MKRENEHGYKTTASSHLFGVHNLASDLNFKVPGNCWSICPYLYKVMNGRTCNGKTMSLVDLHSPLRRHPQTRPPVPSGTVGTAREKTHK